MRIKEGKILINDDITKRRLDKCKKVYLVACWANFGIMEFKYAGKMVWDNDFNELVPLVYDHDDGNGTCDVYIIKSIYHTTTGGCLIWTFNKNKAKYIADKCSIK